MASTSGVGASGIPVMAVAVPQTFELQAAGSYGDSSSEAHSPEVPVPRASDRKVRIVAEQKRRHEFNFQITQMMTFLSDIVHSQRKIDKTSTLRLVASELRNQHIFGDSIKCHHTETWSSAVLKFFDLIGGFMLSVTCMGRICNVSYNVQEKLGYCYIDLLGQDFYSYVHHEDKEILKQHIYPSDLQTGSNPKIFEQHHNFNIRIMRAGARSDPPRYERCRVDGVIRRSDRATANGVQEEQTIKRQRVRHHRTYSSSGNDYVFIGMVHILTTNNIPAKMLPPASYSEYWTRHLIDGRIVQCDQSISLAAGYMTEEVTGTSAFFFMHKDDVRWVICVLRQMYDQSREFGESYYRLMSRAGHFIYMRTRGFLEIDKDTKKVQSFVCVNSVIGEKYGQRMMDDMKRKYSVMVDIDKIVNRCNATDKISELDSNNLENETFLLSDKALIEHPKHLEKIVMHLIEPADSENVEELKLVAPSKETVITAIKNSERVVQETGMRFDSRKRKKSGCGENSEHLKRQTFVSD